MQINQMLMTTMLLFYSNSSYSSQGSETEEASNLESNQLGGVYTIQPAESGSELYVDAYEDSKDYRLVLRGEQKNDSQKWIFTYKGEFGNGDAKTYTIQHFRNKRYVDAWEQKSKDYSLVTRKGVTRKEPQPDGSQEWVLFPIGDNEYLIMQKKTARFVDAYTNTKDNRLVTRDYQDDGSQEWLINIDTDDLEFQSMEYLTNELQPPPAEPYLLEAHIFGNDTSITQSEEFKTERNIKKISFWEHTLGLSVTVGMEFTAGVPTVSQTGGSIEVSASTELMWGNELEEEQKFSATRTLTVPPRSAVKASFYSAKTTLDVPYIMYFKSKATDAVHESYGVWHGTDYANTRYQMEQVPEGLDHPECKTPFL